MYQINVKQKIMSLYKCLYLLPESEYLKATSTAGGVGGTGVAEGIGGSVSDSHVNNIEVSHGGTIVIDKHSNCGGKISPSTDSQSSSSSPTDSVAKQSTSATKSTLPATSSVATPTSRVTNKGFSKKHPKELAASSKKLDKAKKEPNAVTSRVRNDPNAVGTSTNSSERVYDRPSLSYASERVVKGDHVEPMEIDPSVDSTALPVPKTPRQLERAIARKHGQRSQREQEKILLDTLKVARVKELQGEKGVREDRNQNDQERQILHELRDIYRGELKQGGGRNKGGGDLQVTARTKSKPQVNYEQSHSASKRMKREVNAPSSDSHAHGETVVVQPSSGVKRAVDEEWADSIAKRQKAAPKPWLIREKRAASPSWETSLVKKSKSVPKPWLIREKRSPSPSWSSGRVVKRQKAAPRAWQIREKRSPPASWPTSRKKRQKKRKGDSSDSEDSSDNDSDDGSSDDGNEGQYKAYLDKINNSKRFKRVV